MPPSSKLVLSPYATPTVKDMAIILIFFNPAQSIRIVQNLLMTKHMLEKAHIPVYVGEVAFEDKPFVLEEGPTVFQWRSNSYMFYKENVAVLMEKRIPESFTKLMLLDADIIFLQSNWYSVVSQTLNTHDVAQPFQYANRCDFTFHVHDTRKSCLNAHDGHIGYAWAFTRAWFRTHPIFEYALIGSGDQTFCVQIKAKAALWGHDKFYHDDLKSAVFATAPKKTSCDLVVYHLPHGKTENRQHMTRVNALKTTISSMRISSVSAATIRRADGLLEWKPELREKLNGLLLKYFTDRADDSI